MGKLTTSIAYADLRQALGAPPEDYLEALATEADLFPGRAAEVQAEADRVQQLLDQVPDDPDTEAAA